MRKASWKYRAGIVEAGTDVWSRERWLLGNLLHARGDVGRKFDLLAEAHELGWRQLWNRHYNFVGWFKLPRNNWRAAMRYGGVM